MIHKRALYFDDHQIKWLRYLLDQRFVARTPYEEQTNQPILEKIFDEYQRRGLDK